MKIDDLTKNMDEDVSPQDRVPMIKEVFQLVFGRDPSSRELSMYKYGVQSKDEILKKLLEGNEHKKDIERAQKFEETEDRAKDAEHKVAQLKQQIQDSEQESIDLKNLLNEKNMEIAILRKEKEDPYNFTHSEALRYIKTLNESDRSVQSTQPSKVSFETDEEESWVDKLYRLLKF